MTSRHLAITMGDPAGIGPEIIVKACIGLQDRITKGDLRLLIIGSGAALNGAQAALGASVAIPQVNAEDADWPNLCFLQADAEGAPIHPGVLSADGGRFAFKAIEQGVRLTQAGRTAAIVTAPLNKEALNKAGYHYPGHTEMLADLTGVRGSVMLLAHGNMRVSHVSTHVALEDVPKRLTPERLRQVIDLTDDALRRLGIARPKIAVAALNPHAGEGGLFGRQDIDVIGADHRQGGRRRASTSSGRCPAIPSSSSCARANSTLSSRCITTRDISRSSCWASRSILRPALAGALRRQHHARPADYPHLRRSRHRLRYRRQGHCQRTQPDRGDRLCRTAGRRHLT